MMKPSDIAKLICSNELGLVLSGYEALNELTRMKGVIFCENVAQHCHSKLAIHFLEALSCCDVENADGWLHLMNVVEDPLKKAHCYACYHVSKATLPASLKKIFKIILSS